MTLKTFTLARLKAVAAFLGALITFATTVLPLPGDPHIWTGAAAVLTFVSVYVVPNKPADGADYTPRRALVEDEPA